jgi:hypothetical protein
MGAGQSAQAHVLLDRRAWAQGDTVTGSVVFNTNKPVPYHSVTLKVGDQTGRTQVAGLGACGPSSLAVACALRFCRHKSQDPLPSLLLQFVGKERTHWEVRHHSKNGSHTSTYDGKAKIIKAGSAGSHPENSPGFTAAAVCCFVVVANPLESLALASLQRSSNLDRSTPPQPNPQAVMPLLTGPGTLGVGGHRMPFVLSLPAGLPPSFAFHDGSTKASVTYSIKVEVDQVG